MDFKITTTGNNQLDVFFDTNGNIYFIYNFIIYEININYDNTISIIEFIEEEYNELDEYKVINLSKKPDILGELVHLPTVPTSNDNHNVNSSPFYEDELYYENNKVIRKHIRRKNCLSNSSDGEENSSSSFTDSDSEYFLFSNGGLTNPIPIKNLNSNISLYETLLYTTPSYINGTYQMCFKSTIVGSLPMYRLNIFSNGKINFRGIGDFVKYFEFVIFDDKLSIRKI